MKTIKSFDDFDKKVEPVEENIFDKIKQKRAAKKAAKGAQTRDVTNITGVRGKEVWRDDSGKKHKVVWKAQDSNNFIVKLVNDFGWLDDTGNMTPNGETALLQYLNAENAFVNEYGKLDGSFFSTKILVYLVKVDTDRKQKIQFSIVERAVIQQKAESVASADTDTTAMFSENVKFINASLIAAFDAALNNQMKVNLDQTILNVNEPEVDPNVDPNAEQEEEPEVDQEEGEEVIDDVPIEDDSLVRKKFEYQSGADGKLYVITIDKDSETEGLKFWAKSKDGTNEGWIILKNQEPFWSDHNGNTTAIHNAKDREFFIKIYSDEDYLRELVEAFEEKYPNGFDFTIKDILYYNDGSKIYDKPKANPEKFDGTF